jgi:hypothetical protein
MRHLHTAKWDGDLRFSHRLWAEQLRIITDKINRANLLGVADYYEQMPDHGVSVEKVVSFAAHRVRQSQ